jgi:hypothetical protein
MNELTMENPHFKGTPIATSPSKQFEVYKSTLLRRAETMTAAVEGVSAFPILNRETNLWRHLLAGCLRLVHRAAFVGGIPALRQ